MLKYFADGRFYKNVPADGRKYKRVYFFDGGIPEEDYEEARVIPITTQQVCDIDECRREAVVLVIDSNEENLYRYCEKHRPVFRVRKSKAKEKG